MIDQQRVVSKPRTKPCLCGHGKDAHGPMGCEGIFTIFDGGEPGPCYCRAYKEAR